MQLSLYLLTLFKRSLQLNMIVLYVCALVGEGTGARLSMG